MFMNRYEDPYDFFKIKDLRKDQIFDFTYPLYCDDNLEMSEEDKLALKKRFEDKFMLHFRYEMIGYPSLEEFKYHLQDILVFEYPKYKHYFDTSLKAKTLKWWNNKDYEFSQERKLDTTSNGNANTQSQNNSRSESTSNGSDTSTSVNKFSDTPEGSIDNIDRYMTTANKDESTVTTRGQDTGTSSSTGDSTTISSNRGNEVETIKTTEGGNIGVTSSGELVKSWLNDGFIDVERMMLNDCKQIFMQVY